MKEYLMEDYCPVGMSWAEVGNDTIDRFVKPYLLQFDNITYEGSYDITDGITRYCFAIEGYENLLLFLQPQNSSSSPITYGICTVASKSNNESLSVRSAGSTAVTSEFKITMMKIYTISKSNRLTTLGFTTNTDYRKNPSYSFVRQGNSRYIYTPNDVLYLDSSPNATRRTYTTAVSNNLNEIALKRQAIVTNGSTLMDQLEDLYQFYNNNFTQCNYTLIDINGLTYRQIGPNGIFIEDNEE